MTVCGSSLTVYRSRTATFSFYKLQVHERVKEILLSVQTQLVKVTRDRSFLLERLLRHEKPSMLTEEQLADPIMADLFTGAKEKDEAR